MSQAVASVGLKRLERELTTEGDRPDFVEQLVVNRGNGERVIQVVLWFVDHLDAVDSNHVALDRPVGAHVEADGQLLAGVVAGHAKRRVDIEVEDHLNTDSINSSFALNGN